MNKVLQKRFPLLFGIYLVATFVVYYVSQSLLNVIWPRSVVTVGEISTGWATLLSMPPAFAFPIIFLILILIISLIIEKYITKEKLSLHLASKMFFILFISLLFGGWVASLFIFYLNDSFSAVLLISSIASFVTQIILLLLVKYNIN